MKDIVIIGCGITGSLIAHELSKYQLDVAVLEKQIVLLFIQVMIRNLEL